MGNAIRQLKLDISGSDIDLPEQDVRTFLCLAAYMYYTYINEYTSFCCIPQAKDELCLKIDNYIRDRIDAAGEVIVEKSVGKIKEGDVILTYAR